MGMINQLTVYDLIFTALRAAGVAYFGDSIKPAQSREALMLLNAIRAEYSINNRAELKYDQVFTAPVDRQFVTLGTDYSDPLNPAVGDFPVRPSKITQVVIINGTQPAANNYQIPLFTYEEYRRKTVQNVFAIPQGAYIDTEFPIQNMYFYPGLSSGWSVRVEGRRYLTDYEYITDPYIDPPEYFQMLYLELATRLLGLYGQDVPQGMIIQLSGVSKHIKAQTIANSMKRTRNDFKGNGSFNLFSGMSN